MKRSLFVVLALVVGWSSPAFANLTSNPSPVAMGNVNLPNSKTIVATVSSDSTDLLDHFTITGTGCSVVTVVPQAPVTLPALITAVGIAVDVTFDPAVPGAIDCTVSMRDINEGNLGTDFHVTGTGVAPQITTPATQPVNGGSARVLDTALSATTTSFNVLIKNTGNAQLNIQTLALSGSNAADFTITSTLPPPPIQIAAAGSTNITIQFNPSAAGARVATLDIGTNDPVTPTAHVDLTASGTAARIAATDISFGPVVVGSFADNTTGVTNAETINPGPLKITGATLSGAGFAFNSNGGACTTPTTCTFTNIFAPTTISVRCAPGTAQTGTILGTVTLTSDTDAGGDASVGLACDVKRADASVDPTSIDFGAAVVVGTTVQQDVKVTNSGNIDLLFTATKTGARSGEYAFSGCATSCTVTAGSTQTFTVSFTPTAIGAANITVNVGSNDPNNATIPIPVTASSVAPVMSAPATLQFNTVEVLSNKTLTLTVTNTGGADMTITSADFGINPATYSIINGSTGTQTVTKGGGTAAWDIRCTPATQGAKDGTFVIASDAFGAPSTTVNLRCTGQEGILAITVPSPASLNFGGVAENTTKTLQFTLKNTGNLTVSNIVATVTPNNVGYSLTNMPASLAANATQVVDVVFAPLSGNDGGPATVTFTGTWGTGPKPLQSPPQLALDGDGLTAAFDVTPPTIDFGDIRFDKTATRTFCIINTNTAGAGTDISIQTIAIAPAAGTSTGEFSVPVVTGVTHVRRKQCMSAAVGTDVTLPTTIPAEQPAQQLEVTVTVDPANRTGPMAATLTVTSTLASPNTTRTVALAANSTSATIAVDPGNLVDFGTVDIQGPAPAPKSITITNGGDAPLDLGAFARSDGGTNTHFSFTLPAGVTTLAKSESVVIAVTYTPTVVTVPTESINITHTIAGDIQAPANGTITLRGKAIDREIDIQAQPVFPDTFRNPGADAPVRPVRVTNTGEATLHVTATMVTSADPAVWTLVDGSAQDIPGGTTFEYLVKFAPTTIGPAPTGTLTLTNDDSSEPMAVIDLTGNGIDRNVAFGAQRIDVGFTGIGVPVVINDALLVASMNASSSFRLSKIDFADADPACIDNGMTSDATAFAVVDPPNGDELAASAQRTFSIAFSSETPGHFVASAELFLDSDPVPQAKVCVEGTAVFVDAHGGGGCASGHDTGGGALILIGIAVMLRRRKGAALAVVVVAIAIPASARADKLSISIFDPTPSLTATNFQLQSAEVGVDGAWVATAIVSNATDPLTLDAGANGAAAVIQRSTMLELGGAYAFLGRYEAGAHVPFYFQDGAAAGDPQMMFTHDPASGAAMGDLTMHGKARLWRRGGAAIGAAGQLTLPTANDDSFTGTEKPSLRMLGLASLVPDAMEHRLSLSAQLGGIARAKSKFANIEQGSGVTWGLGLSVRMLDSTYLAAEMFGDTLPAARKGTATTSAVSLSPIEWLAGLRWVPDRRVSLGIAVGRGLTSAAGSPSLRGVLELSYSPSAPEIAPIHGPKTPKLDLDSDGDGILDSVDKCPNEPEDKDLFDDEDGCPDLDNDHDGIPDAVDKCPLDPEDKDGFEDTDGCPDKDNDGDGIPDTVDKCPNEPEDKDGHDDLDGCPDPDNDHDGIPDTIDKCPNEPETINGNKDDDGCPDAGDSSIVLSPDRIETLDSVQFERRDPAKLSKASFNLLGQVGSTMRAHPEIIRLRVTCHINPSGNYEKDQELSDKRAAAVRDWLVQWGIDGKRVEARGFGGTKPLAQPDQKNAASINDRIELIILERK